MAGTVATKCVDLVDGRAVLLTCNHVAAALNWGRSGDFIVQPSTEDGGRTPHDVCGRLLRYVPVHFFGAANRVDGALVAVPLTTATDHIEWLGPAAGTRRAHSLVPLETIYKVGRTSGLTSGRVVAVDVAGWLAYPWPLDSGASAFFEDMIVTTAMAGFGDSGALGLDSQRRAVGLLFGGSWTHTFFNDVTAVEQQLGVRLA